MLWKHCMGQPVGLMWDPAEMKPSQERSKIPPC